MVWYYETFFLLICFSSTVNFVEEIERYIWVVLVFRLRCFVDGICVVEVGRMVGVGGSRALGLAAWTFPRKKIENMKHELCWENCALHSGHFSFRIAVLCRSNLSRRSWGVGGRWMLTGAHDVTNHERCPKTWQCETWTLLRIQYAIFWRCNSSDCSPLSIRFVSLKFQPRGGRFGLASV